MDSKLMDFSVGKTFFCKVLQRYQLQGDALRVSSSQYLQVKINPNKNFILR